MGKLIAFTNWADCGIMAKYQVRLEHFSGGILSMVYDYEHEYDERKIVQIFLETLLTIQNIRQGTIWSFWGNHFHCIEAIGPHSERLKGKSIAISEKSIVRSVFESGELIVSHVDSDSRHNVSIDLELNVATDYIIALPLILETGECYGVVELVKTKDEWGEIKIEKKRIELIRKIVLIGALSLSRFILHQRQLTRNDYLQEQLKTFPSCQHIVGQHECLQACISEMQKIASSDYPVLITGESGTGKELFAREIHRISRRNENPFVVQNCSNFTESLVQDELFGHVRGAYSDALYERKGLFETAHLGTLFLDEVGNMSPQFQASLLRVIEDGEVKRIGGKKVLFVDTRIIAATNLDLEQAVDHGFFRKDLFFRLNVHRIHLPSLRQRKSDIPLLIDYFITIEAIKLNRARKIISPRALTCLMNYQWPGNIRELENLVKNLMVCSAGNTIRCEHLPLHFRELNETYSPQEEGEKDKETEKIEKREIDLFTGLSWQNVERRYVQFLLEKHDGNISAAAREAGLKRPTFDSRLKKLGINRNSL